MIQTTLFIKYIFVCTVFKAEQTEKHVYDSFKYSPEKHVYDSFKYSPEKRVYDSFKYSPEQHVYDSFKCSPEKRVYDSFKCSPEKHVYDSFKYRPEKHVYHSFKYSITYNAGFPGGCVRLLYLFINCNHKTSINGRVVVIQTLDLLDNQI